MEHNNDRAEIYCLGCLHNGSEYKIREYKMKYHGHFRTNLEVDLLNLCYLCARIAQHAELFLQNVQSNQILLQNCVEDILSTAVEELRPQVQLSIALSTSPVQIDSISDQNTDRFLSEPFICITSNISGKIESNEHKTINCINASEKCDSIEECFSAKNVLINGSGDVSDHNIKQEFEAEVLNHLDGDFIDDSDVFQDSFIKEEDEDDFPLKELLKGKKNGGVLEVSLESLKNKAVKRSKKNKNEGKKKLPKTEKKVAEDNESLGIETLYISMEQCMEERRQMALERSYQQRPYKCRHCVKGFTTKPSYDTHLQRHSKASGAFECEVCRVRCPSAEQLTAHARCHNIRYRCRECGMTRVCRLTIKDHVSSQHRAGAAHACPHCHKRFKRQVSMRKHVRYTHLSGARVTCDLCRRSYANTGVLRAHMVARHPAAVGAGGEARAHACPHCPAAFAAPSQLRAHAVKHSQDRHHYCVECDKGFKTEVMLKQHLTKAQPHVSYSELPMACDHCERRFSSKADLRRHTDSVHLHRKPHVCAVCGKAFRGKWNLTEHVRYTHEGHKRPLKHPCHLCDKIFNRREILKSHMRTHTGERPYACAECPARFTQAGVLATHRRLVHLRLTRDGRPKHAPPATKTA